MGIRLRKLTKAELAAAKKKRLKTPPPRRQTANKVLKQRKAQREAYHKKDFKDAERRGRGIYTEEEKKQIKKTQARRKAWARAKAVHKKRVPKASSRTVRKSKGYA